MTTSDLVGPIVAGVDGSDAALHAVRWAADEAAREHAPLRLVHVVSLGTVAYSGGIGPPQNYFDALESDGARQLDEATNLVRRTYPDLEIDVTQTNGEPAPTLIEASEGARLVVLGSRGLGGFTGLLAGSNAVALAACARCPVAVIRGSRYDSAPPTEGPVVVGVDGSPAGDAALALAMAEASWRGVDLVAVHTWIEFASDRAYAYAQQFVMDWDAIETREREVLAERLAGWQEKYPDVVVRRVVTRDPPVRGLLDHAADAQLLVVGSRGRGGFAGMLLGSTSQALIYHATCPLIVVRPGTTD